MIVKVTEREMIGMEYYCNSEQSMLRILQEKGAPIEGQIYFTMKDGWTVKKELDPYDRSIVFTFKEKKK